MEPKKGESNKNKPKKFALHFGPPYYIIIIIIFITAANNANNAGQRVDLV